MLNTPFSPWPSFSEEEVNAVQQVLRSNRVNYWTGNEGREFEKEFAAWCGTRYAIGLANGTVALDLALHGLGIGPGDEVVVTPRSFIASVSSVVNAGATPIFADIDEESGNLTAHTILAALTPRTKAVLCVHLAGWPCDMDPIMALAKQYEFKVIEDCAQAHGARYKGQSVGSIGHVAAWSFCQDKIITTGGEGGMVTTNDENLWRVMWSFRDHGKSHDAVYRQHHPPGFRWVHESFGTNWRMMELQAVIGRIQLKKICKWSAARQANALQLFQAFKPLSEKTGLIRLPSLTCADCKKSSNLSESNFVCNAGCMHAFYRFYIYICLDQLAPDWTRDRIIDAINQEGVPCYFGSCSEIYLEKAFDGTGWRPKQRLPGARALGETSIMFLVHPTLTQEEIKKTCRVTSRVLSNAMKTVF